MTYLKVLNKLFIYVECMVYMYLFQNLPNVLNDLHSKKIFFDSNKISLNQTNLCIAIWPKKSFFDLKKCLDYFFSVN